jgi:hypothetical protein
MNNSQNLQGSRNIVTHLQQVNEHRPVTVLRHLFEGYSLRTAHTGSSLLQSTQVPVHALLHLRSDSTNEAEGTACQLAETPNMDAHNMSQTEQVWLLLTISTT